MIYMSHSERYPVSNSPDRVYLCVSKGASGKGQIGSSLTQGQMLLRAARNASGKEQILGLNVAGRSNSVG